VELRRGIEPRFRPYEGRVLPLNERSLVEKRGLEPRYLGCDASALPVELHPHWRMAEGTIPTGGAGGALSRRPENLSRSPSDGGG
jgi:hypothetical protein